ncbi:HopJ type III effector protein [Polaribacter sp. Asnod1-A03]|uniref:HopJ type III effector protein n=1 Tax=Polaribacter sp. Asnod1-A03 TaxID=3160581 RepID=UPI00386DD8BF
MTIQEFKTKLKSNSTEINFAETMQVIEDNYNFTPTAFTNGDIKNNAGENSGSCKLFAFAAHQQLTKEEALACFGEHYKNVLEDENGDSHQNIRNFMQTGFKGLTFDGEALTLKN